MAKKKDSTSRRLERSKFGRLMAGAIAIRRLASQVELRCHRADTLTLITVLEKRIEEHIDFCSKLERNPADILRTAQKGDRRVLVKYLKNEKNPITPDIRKLLITFLAGKKRESANRPRAAATATERCEIAAFVGARILSGANYMAAVEAAHKAFRCSEKKVHSACKENAELVSVVLGMFEFVPMITPIANEILRRGEPEYCERARTLLERWEAFENEQERDLSDDDERLIERLALARYPELENK
jgi:hypothetical protein